MHRIEKASRPIHRIGYSSPKQDGSGPEAGRHSMILITANEKQSEHRTVAGKQGTGQKRRRLKREEETHRRPIQIQRAGSSKSRRTICHSLLASSP